MSKPSPTKIEKRALNTLEGIIDNHDTMDYQFNYADKEMTWDGFIWLNKEDNGVLSKDNVDSRIAVQIKGHYSKDYTTIGNDKINYSVDLKDLELYATEKGVLYFQIFLDDAGNEVYYSSLYPSKIADYLELAEKRGNANSITIQFTKLEKNPLTLFYVVKQFSNEAKLQGSAYTPIVKDRIRSDEFQDLKVVNLSVVGTNDVFEVLKRLSTGDICLHGKTDINERYFRPIEWHDNTTFYSGRDVEQSISIDGIVYYDKYKCIIDSNGGIELIPSPNLKMRISEGKYDFSTKSSLYEMSNDAKFLLALHTADAYYIGEQKLNIETHDLSEEFENRLKFIIDAYDATHAIGLDSYIKIDSLSDEERKSLITLVNLYLGAYKDRFTDVYTRYDWKYGDKYYPLLINKTERQFTIESSIYTKQYVVLLPDPESNELVYRMPLFAYQKPEILANLVLCDFDEFENQILSSDYNPKTTETLNSCTLSLIGAYDICKDKHFLELAQLMINRIMQIDNGEMIILNNIQIKEDLGHWTKTILHI